ncbi:complexin-3-like [Paramisgurnus dabryanus]|uniref:complexin-3-like n=1 Tax=Paramisgurnus dabryanus TaxID=90735 RepID=UPI0031F43F20
MMESGLKKSLLAPIKTLTYCVTGEKTQPNWTKQKSKPGSKVRSATHRLAGTKDAHLLRSYQAELERERKLRDAVNAQKNAERAAMRTHFRRKYHLSENVKDSEHLRSVRGKASLPRDLAKMIYPETPAKDGDFGLLSTFQSLGFSRGIFTGNKQTQTPVTVNTESCKLM